jgi:hypothetical protein
MQPAADPVVCVMLHSKTERFRRNAANSEKPRMAAISETHVDVRARHDAADQAAGHDGPKAQLPLAGLRLVELLLARGVGLRLGLGRRRVVIVGGHERSR